MEVERLWGKEPGWFSTLDRDSQVRLFAHFRVHKNPTGKGSRGAGSTSRRSKSVRIKNDSASGFWGI